MSNWSQVGENLVRHKGGTIYLRAKVAGKIKRILLGTSDPRIVKSSGTISLKKLRDVAHMMRLHEESLRAGIAQGSSPLP